MFKKLFRVTFDGLLDALERAVDLVILGLGLFGGVLIGLTEPDQFNPVMVEVMVKVMSYLVVVLLGCQLGMVSYRKWGRPAPEV